MEKQKTFMYGTCFKALVMRTVRISQVLPKIRGIWAVSCFDETNKKPIYVPIDIHTIYLHNEDNYKKFIPTSEGSSLYITHMANTKMANILWRRHFHNQFIEVALYMTYRQTSNINQILISNKIGDHSDVIRASPVGAAPIKSPPST